LAAVPATSRPVTRRLVTLGLSVPSSLRLGIAWIDVIVCVSVTL
jgi:hypothetical protein